LVCRRGLARRDVRQRYARARGRARHAVRVRSLIASTSDIALRVSRLQPMAHRMGCVRRTILRIAFRSAASVLVLGPLLALPGSANAVTRAEWTTIAYGPVTFRAPSSWPIQHTAAD